MLSWDVECGIGEAGCAKLISALERANAAFSAALVFRRPVIIKISAISGGASGKRAEPTEADAFAATDAPQHQLPARIGSALVSYPQTLAKQMSVLPDEDLLPFDAIISVRWPEGGFFFEGDMASTSSVQNPNFGW